VLILETSGRVGQVALAEGQRLMRVRRLDEARRHARDLAPAVGELLAALGWRPRDLHSVIVSRGPGSYTGLRVGIMAAKALAYATGCALVAVDTFAAVAAQAPDEVLILDVLADAQQDQVYLQRFARAKVADPLVPVSPLTIQPLTTWLASRQGSEWASGPGIKSFEGKLPPGLLRVEPGAQEPHPDSLLRLGLARLEAGQTDDFFALEPLYRRPSSAEEKWQAQSRTGGR
jgi:tRNA threonylcarbamoyladenosine biosynthesis protein TsaB